MGSRTTVKYRVTIESEARVCLQERLLTAVVSMRSPPKRQMKPGRATDTDTKMSALSPGERAALREHVREWKAEVRGRSTGVKVDGEKAVRAAIAAMSEPYRSMGERLHAIVRSSAPDLVPRTWYGMPAYAKDGTVVCFFRSGEKFKERYLTLGFNDEAQLDDGTMWPVAFALTALTAADEERIAALLKRAVG